MKKYNASQPVLKQLANLTESFVVEDTTVHIVKENNLLRVYELPNNKLLSGKEKLTEKNIDIFFQAMHALRVAAHRPLNIIFSDSMQHDNPPESSSMQQYNPKQSILTQLKSVQSNNHHATFKNKIAYKPIDVAGDIAYVELINNLFHVKVTSEKTKHEGILTLENIDDFFKGLVAFKQQTQAAAKRK